MFEEQYPRLACGRISILHTDSVAYTGTCAPLHEQQPTLHCQATCDEYTFETAFFEYIEFSVQICSWHPGCLAELFSTLLCEGKTATQKINLRNTPLEIRNIDEDMLNKVVKAFT